MGKFKSKKVEYDGMIFDSITEFQYYTVLKRMQEKGEITDLKCQVPFLLVPSFKDSYGTSVRKMEYISDFTYIKDGKLHIVDVKGSMYNITIESKNKIKMCKYLNQDTIFEIVVKYKDVWYNLEDKQEKKQYMEMYSARKKKKSKKK